MIELTPRCQFESEGAGDECPFKHGTFCERVDCATESWEVVLPRCVSDHEKRLRKLACCVTGAKPVTLHHCRGGSIAQSLFGGPGVGQKQNPALQIPLHAELHVGRHRIDGALNGGVQSWEVSHGSQVEHLSSTSRLLQYSVWTLAWQWASPLVRRRVESFLMQSRSRFLQAPIATGDTRSSGSRPRDDTWRSPT